MTREHYKKTARLIRILNKDECLKYALYVLSRNNDELNKIIVNLTTNKG